ncbi:MAG TPA: O-GlcNAc transferase, partial [Verrucomicrobiae bacterium]|nr:O-GlcNAc transferase [Verrucomicrobiae bacterium]
MLLVVATFIAYQPMWHAGFIWDDDAYVTNNQTLHDLNGLKQIWLEPKATPQYYPLVYTTFWLEYHTWKLNPLGYHVVNVLLHALGSLLLWRVLKRLALPGAWLAAAIFALHPVNVESVAWVTERKNVLSAVLFFAAALAYLRFDGLAESKKRLWTWWCAALLLFIGALLSKTVACSLPAALLLVCWWKKGRVTMADVLPLIPFFIMGLGLGLHTAWLEKHHVGASGAEWSLSFIERCLIAGRALWFYAGKLVWPSQLTFIYPRWQIGTGVWWQWLFPLAVLAVVVTLWRARKRLGRGPLVAVLFFAGTLLPALGFFDLYPMRYSFVADH